MTMNCTASEPRPCTMSNNVRSKQADLRGSMMPVQTTPTSMLTSNYAPSMPYDILFVHTIIHPTRASEHASAAITRDTRVGEAEAGTTAGKSSDGKLDGAISVFDFSTLCQLSADQAQEVYLSPAVSSKTRVVS